MITNQQRCSPNKVLTHRNHLYILLIGCVCVCVCVCRCCSVASYEGPDATTGGLHAIQPIFSILGTNIIYMMWLHCVASILVGKPVRIYGTEWVLHACMFPTSCCWWWHCLYLNQYNGASIFSKSSTPTKRIFQEEQSTLYIYIYIIICRLVNKYVNIITCQPAYNFPLIFGLS